MGKKVLPKGRSPAGKALEQKQYAPKIIPSKKIYSRKNVKKSDTTSHEES